MWQKTAIREKQGVVSGLFVLMYGLFRIFLEQYREPDIQLGYFFGILTMGQLLSVPLVVLGLSVVVWKYKKVKN